MGQVKTGPSLKNPNVTVTLDASSLCLIVAYHGGIFKKRCIVCRVEGWVRELEENGTPHGVAVEPIHNRSTFEHAKGCKVGIALAGR